MAVIHPGAWVRDAVAWQSSLHSANRLRLAGWRLRRVPGEPASGSEAELSEEELWGPAPSDEEFEAAQQRASRRVQEMRTAVMEDALSVEAAAQQLSLTPQELRTMGDRGKLAVVGVPPDERVPSWQLRDGGLLAGLERLVAAFPGGPTWMSVWAVTPVPELNGRTPADVLRDGDVERVVALALSRGG